MSTTPTDNTNNNPIMIDPRMLNNYYNHDDEINLIDLWLSLVKQKNVFFISLFLAVAVATVYIIVTPETYTYKTDISIGTQTQTQFIQSPQAIVANFNNAIIPKILRQQYINQPDNKLNVSISIPKKTDSALLSSIGTIEQKEAITKLHQQLINILSESHRDKVAHMLTYLNDELISSQATLARLIEKSTSTVSNSDKILMQIVNLEDTIRQAKRSIAQFTDTHSVMGTVQSIKPNNKSSKLILAVSIILGLFLGIFAALFAGFIAKVKEQSE